MRQSNSVLPIEQLYSADNSWYIRVDPNATEYMHFRVNLAAELWAGHPLLDVRLHFSITFNRPNPDGAPDALESQVGDDIGQRICALVKESGPALHVATFTTGIYKEWVFYLANRDAVPGIHQRIQSEVSTHEVYCEGELDREWGEFAWILDKCPTPKDLN